MSEGYKKYGRHGRVISKDAPDAAGSPKKKSCKGKKVLIVLATVFGLIVALCIALAVYLLSLNNSIQLQQNEQNQKLHDALVAQESTEQPFYVLLLGLDKENQGASRSDAIIVARIDPSNAKITMVSIPRDTMIELPGYGRQKINAAYSYGGASGAVEAITKFTGVSMNHYVEINFEGLKTLVNAVGGIYVDVPVANTETGYGNMLYYLGAGEQWMDGNSCGG